MEELVDLIATDAPASDISDRIKDVLYAKASAKVDAAKPLVADIVFNDDIDQEQEE
tara:strand:+ start:345 stop:512 length:168 start_codon:yes stop_codon:yes gene_type:complete